MTTYTEQDRKHWAKAAGFKTYPCPDKVGVTWVEGPWDRPRHLRFWNPDTNKADCFELLEALMEADSGVNIKLARMFYQGGVTLQEAICNLAVEIGRKMEESE